MSPEQDFETYRQQIGLITGMVAVGRRSAALDAREMRFRAACACAALSLSRDLEAIVELEKLVLNPNNEHQNK